MATDAQRMIEMGRTVVRTEAAAVAALEARLGDDFARACRLILDSPGHVVVTGMGKSGHIGRKLAATLASTGTPAFFVHPAEASHGDLGMLRAGSPVLALSNSGETEEIVRLLPVIKRLGGPLIALCGRTDSTLVRHADAHLDTAVTREACPLGLAPTASTAAQLAMGDALAIALLESRGFTSEDFALAHPGGSLGRRLLVHIRDVMHSGDELPRIGPDATVLQAVAEMTRTRLGFCAVVGDDDAVQGILTDGDLRRSIEDLDDLRTAPVRHIMTPSPRSIPPHALAAEAVDLMQRHRIQGLLVIDSGGRLVGALNFQDLLAAGVV